jgi:hypothetical protein
LRQIAEIHSGHGVSPFAVFGSQINGTGSLSDTDACVLARDSLRAH